MDLKQEFVLRAQAPDRNLSALCREAGISRKTAYFWLKRFEEGGADALEERVHGRKPMKDGSAELVLRIVELRRHPDSRFWGPKKLKVVLERELDAVPSVRTIARVCKRLELAPLRTKPVHRVTRAKREGGALRTTQCNAIWTFDFKGWWKTQDGRRFEPLTVRDAASRFILLCVHCPETVEAVKAHCEKVFARYGVPALIRADNGPPFAAANAMGGLSRLSAWWMSLGITVDFSRSATPSDNGAHERMHGDVQRELAKAPAANAAAQQLLVDHWVRVFNTRRPHEALGQRTPASMYRRSKTKMKDVIPTYPAGDRVCRVSSRGRVAMDGYQRFIGTVFAGMKVGLRLFDGEIYARFFHMELGALRSVPQKNR